MVTLALIMFTFFGLYHYEQRFGFARTDLKSIVADDLDAETPKPLEEHLQDLYGEKVSQRRINYFTKHYATFLDKEIARRTTEHEKTLEYQRQKDAALETFDTIRLANLQAFREISYQDIPQHKLPSPPKE